MKNKTIKVFIVSLLLTLIFLAWSQVTSANQRAGQRSSGYVQAQSGVTTWARTYGGSNDDYASSIVQTSDGGYVFAGTTTSFGAGGNDFWVVKVDALGNIVWQKAYGGVGDDKGDPSSVVQTSDGGYAVAGRTNSFGAGSNDIWVIRLNSSGDLVWSKTYGGVNTDDARQIITTADGGFIVVGDTLSFGTGDWDAWLLKLNADGTISWQKTYGRNTLDQGFSVAQTSDGGYVVSGYVSFANQDASILRLDSDGNMLWSRSYGGLSNDWASSIKTTTDGGFIVGGVQGDVGFWILKLDSSGAVQWQNGFSGLTPYNWTTVSQVGDGGYIFAASAQSFGAGLIDMLVVRLDSLGNIRWQKTYGTSNFDYALSVAVTSDGGFIVAGYTNALGAGGYDAWVLKLDENGNLGGSCTVGSAGASTPTSLSGIALSLTITAAISSATPAAANVTPVSSSAQVTTQCAPFTRYDYFFPFVSK